MSEAVLKIYGDIGEPDNMLEIFGVEEETISAKLVSDWLDENKAAKEITVKINSRGGDVQEGWTIYDLLANSGKKIKTIGEGKVYSIATIIFLAGEEREFLQNADGQIHNPYIPPYTLADKYEADDLESIAESLKQEEEKILNFYVEKTGADESKLATLMEEDTKLSAEDMLEFGFATKIIEPVKAYAFNKNSYHKKTSIMAQTIEDEKKFMDKVGEAVTKSLNALGLSRVNPTDQTLKDKDGKEFKVEREEGSPAVGDKASPDGSFEMSDGRTFIISGGAISDIKAPAVDKTDLEIANEKITSLEAEIEAGKTAKIEAEAAKTEAETAKTEAENEKVKAVAIVKEMEELKNSWKPEARSRNFANPDRVGRIDLAQVRENRKAKQAAELAKAQK